MGDHLGIEGDEGSTMLEDVVSPAKATLMSHGQISHGYAQEGNVALPGVLRSGGMPLSVSFTFFFSLSLSPSLRSFGVVNAMKSCE